MKASILAVGTELTSGQITNRNAAWLSARLGKIGIEVVLHEAVADDRAAIHSSLDRCAAVSGLILVTGGLGPTSDDFTREVIAQWAEAPLEFHPPSWKHIESRLNRFAIPIAESNRQQCFYPKGAEILENPKGTANGFRLKARDRILMVLPGPPAEITSVWEKAEIDQDLTSRFPGLSSMRLFTWECLGNSEAALGELTEAALAGSGLRTGYRVHRPYIEIKVWCPEEGLQKAEPYLARLESRIAPWVYAKNGQNLARDLIRTLSRGEEVEILDSATGGILAERLSSVLREPDLKEQADSFIIATEWALSQTPEQWVARTLAQADPTVITLAMSGFTESGEWFIGMKENSTVHQEKIQAPWSAPELTDRIRRHATEVSLKRWIEWLHQSMQ